MEKILIVTTDWGHGSIAKSIREVTEKKYKTDLAVIGVEPFSKVSYELIYKYFPSLFKIVFWFSEIKILKKLFDSYVERSYKGKIRSVIKRSKPNIVMNTYFAFNSSLESFKDKFSFRFINVLADPLTFSRILISENTKNLVFDEYSLRKLKTFEPQADGQLVGWFTEKKFYEIGKKERSSVRKELGLSPNRFTLCITSGSEGTYHVLKIVKTFLSPRYDIQVLIMCGNNKQLLDTVHTLRSVSEKIGGPKIIAVAYTKEIHKYMRAAYIVVGKAGPNTIFESVATLTPFFAISHVAGQEDGNLEIIKRYGVGFVEERIVAATKNIQEIIESPKRLAKFQRNLKILAKYCQTSEENLLKVLKP
jgi:processive 1,2-diacylglycerol beta-glucosyltransferase